MPAMVGVSAASTNSRKNKVPITRPAGISTNAVGRTLNTRSGPCAGFKPYWKTRGKIIAVASTDTITIDALINKAERTNDTSPGTYAPYASMIAMPTPVA